MYTIPFMEQVWACTIRQYQILWGDKVMFIGKSFLVVFQALIIGSLFYNQPATPSGTYTRGGVILYSSLKMNGKSDLVSPSFSIHLWRQHQN